MSDPKIYVLLMLVREGGTLVSSGICSDDEIALARAEDRFTVDSDGFGYVYRPPPRSTPIPKSGRSGRYKTASR